MSTIKLKSLLSESSTNKHNIEIPDGNIPRFYIATELAGQQWDQEQELFLEKWVKKD